MGSWDSAGSNTYEVFEAIKAALPNKSILKNFEPNCTRVAFENMGGRAIRKGQTLCGWSWDNDRVSDHDDSPKILLILGKSTISRGFKYSKEDHCSLDVHLSPGDILLMYGDARQWVSAVTGYRAHEDAQDGPYDFVHVWLLDHRRLKQERPAEYKKIHAPDVPEPGGKEYKWMQFAYTLGPERDATGFLKAELRDGSCFGKVSTSALEEEKRGQGPSLGQDDSRRRRWQSKQRILAGTDRSLGA